MAFSLDECIEKLLTKQLLVEALIKGCTIYPQIDHFICLILLDGLSSSLMHLCLEICEKTKELLMRESNVVHISAPVTVVGDIHGWDRVSFRSLACGHSSAIRHHYVWIDNARPDLNFSRNAHNSCVTFYWRSFHSIYQDSFTTWSKFFGSEDFVRIQIIYSWVQNDSFLSFKSQAPFY